MSKEFLYGWLFGVVVASVGYVIITVGWTRQARRRDTIERREWTEKDDDYDYDYPISP